MKVGRLAALVVVAVVIGIVAKVGGPQTTHATTASRLGTARSSDAMVALLDEPGPVTVETIVGADWAVPLSGLINLDHERARGLEDRDEAIDVPLHAIRHPQRGLFIIDTGAARGLRDLPRDGVKGAAAHMLGLDRFEVRTDTATFLAAQGEPLRGVFLTHLHLDHISGLDDVPRDVPIYTGAGEAAMRGAEHLVGLFIVDHALEGRPALREWQFEADAAGRFEAVVDVFGDGSVWAIHVPGHTDGSTAYLVRTPTHPILIAGDACHTTWGWEHEVEPGTFSHDVERSRGSLAALEQLVREHPQIEVRVGHQGH